MSSATPSATSSAAPFATSVPGHSSASAAAPVRTGRFLRRALWADALTSGAVGLLMIGGAGLSAAPLGLDRALLLAGGLLLVPFVAFVAWLASRPQVVPRGAVRAVIVMNLLWAAQCVWLLAGGITAPTLLGELFIGLHIVTVLMFAELEFIGLRRA